MKNGQILYYYGNNPYINLTNKCSNNCEFCVRNYSESLCGYHLWFDKEPQYSNVEHTLLNAGFNGDIVTFCGFGEPTCKYELLLKTAKLLKERFNIRLKLNTNGQGNLINRQNIIPQLSEYIDEISISLNAESNRVYQQLCKPFYGEDAYPSVINFIKLSVDYFDSITASIVSGTIADEERCQEIAERFGINFRVR